MKNLSDYIYYYGKKTGKRKTKLERNKDRVLNYERKLLKRMGDLGDLEIRNRRFDTIGTLWFSIGKNNVACSVCVVPEYFCCVCYVDHRTYGCGYRQAVKLIAKYLAKNGVKPKYVRPVDPFDTEE